MLSSFIDEDCFVPFGLETSDRRKPAKCLSPPREANKIIYVFVPLLSCHIINKHVINILLTELGWSLYGKILTSVAGSLVPRRSLSVTPQLTVESRIDRAENA